MEEIKSVGIIGLGSFGRFAASLVPVRVDVLGYDIGVVKSDIRQAPLDAVCAADVVVLAVPLGVYGNTLPKLGRLLKPDTLIIDVCSVKKVPESIFDTYLSDHTNILMTHPLFGPQSAGSGTAGHRLVVTKSRGKRATTVLKFCEDQLGLEIDFMSGDEHDETMAKVHALTFFVARGLASMDLDNVSVKTPSYEMLRNLVRFDKTHSNELFETIELGNPYAASVRNKLIDNLHTLEAEISSGGNILA
jgi:prephenate dehydrogenase